MVAKVMKKKELIGTRRINYVKKWRSYRKM